MSEHGEDKKESITPYSHTLITTSERPIQCKVVSADTDIRPLVACQTYFGLTNVGSNMTVSVPQPFEVSSF